MVEIGTVKTLSAYPTTPQPTPANGHHTKQKAALIRSLWMQAEMKFFALAFLTVIGCKKCPVVIVRYFGRMVTITLLYRVSRGVPLSVTFRMK
jgi:hypothetical protein